MDIRLGCLCNLIAPHYMFPDYVPAPERFFDDKPGHEFPNILARNGDGGVADCEGIQFVCHCFQGCKNSDERAYERSIDLHDRGEGRLKTLLLPA